MSTIPGDERAFVLGLDGVPWGLLEEWARAGTLPNFERVLTEGAAGPLRSTTPASTPLAWPSIATGVWPDKHGIYSFQRVTSAHAHEMYTATDRRCASLWEMLSPAVVANLPMTYPADDIDGKLVSGMMAPEMDEDFAAPSSLVDEIEREIPDYRVSLQWGEYADDPDDLVAAISSLVDAREELMHHLMETDAWRLFFFTYTAPDRLQHLVWDEDVLRDHYRRLDRILGDVIEYVDRHDATLFVVSDHGFGPLRKKVAANAVLEANGYLTRERDTGSGTLIESLGLTKGRVRALLDRLGVDEEELARRYLPQSAVNRLAATIPGDHSLFDVDHCETTAFVHEFGNLYVNDTERFDAGTVPPGAVDGLKSDLTTLFESLTDPETGEPVLDVADGDEVFPTDPHSPDLVLDPAEGYGVSISLTDERFVTPAANADHESTGMVLAWGDHVRAGGRPNDASVVDVAPTVLHATGRPVPADADGRVLTELFEPSSPPATRDVTAQRYDQGGRETGDATDPDGLEDVEQRLQGLGYL